MSGAARRQILSPKSANALDRRTCPVPASISAKGIVYVLKVMDHAEYDKASWIDACGCYEPPPKRKKGK
jgi:hypothetical protein